MHSNSRLAFTTGTSSGIGCGIAEKLQAQGVSVAGVGRRIDQPGIDALSSCAVGDARYQFYQAGGELDFLVLKPCYDYMLKKQKCRRYVITPSILARLLYRISCLFPFHTQWLGRQMVTRAS